MEEIILLLICIGIILHRKLSAYWEIGNMPSNFQFIKYVFLFNVLLLINCIWLFGIISGIVLFVLTFYQVIYSAFLWPFMIPDIVSDLKSIDKGEIDFTHRIKEPKKVVYIGWRFLIIFLFFLTAINFIVGEYSVLHNKIFEFSNDSFKSIILFTLISIITGNALRIITIKILFRNNTL
jgi:hypothetical protein